MADTGLPGTQVIDGAGPEAGPGGKVVRTDGGRNLGKNYFLPNFRKIYNYKQQYMTECCEPFPHRLAGSSPRSPCPPCSRRSRCAGT